MTQHTSLPRLHMGCGEALRSQWLLGVAQPEYNAPPAVPRKPNGVKRKRERTRG